MDGIDMNARSAAWARNPEPSMPPRDPQTIVEPEPVAYIWNTQNETDEWLHFDGEPVPVER